MGHIDYICERKFITLSDFFFNLVRDDTVQGTRVLKNTDDLFDGCIIYIVYNHISSFIKILPAIKARFTLISGLSDFTAPFYSDHIHVDGTVVLKHPKLIAWYALNITHEHPKLHHLPIGIPRSIPFLGSGYDVDKKDLPGFEEYIAWYNISTFTDMEWVYRTAAGDLDGIIEAMRRKINSPNLFYVSFTASNSDKSNIGATRGFRRALEDYIRKETPFEIQPLRPWKEYVDMVRQYKYTIEPFGRCMDGYRVWESIYLGTIPIVFRSPINELHEKLPVLIIDTFDQLTPEYLESQYPILLKRQYEMERLDMKYWRDKITSHHQTQ